MRVRLTATKHQQNMVKYDSKVICVSEGEVYLLALKFKNEEGEVLTVTPEVWCAMRDAVDEYVGQVREKQKLYKQDHADDFTIRVIDGEKGCGLLIKKHRPDIDPSMIARGLNKQIAAKFNAVV